MKKLFLMVIIVMVMLPVGADELKLNKKYSKKYTKKIETRKSRGISFGNGSITFSFGNNSAPVKKVFPLYGLTMSGSTFNIPGNLIFYQYRNNFLYMLVEQGPNFIIYEVNLWDNFYTRTIKLDWTMLEGPNGLGRPVDIVTGIPGIIMVNCIKEDAWDPGGANIFIRKDSFLFNGYNKFKLKH